ncbi:hypothetical protein EHQ82_21320 [Leptospira selangorensis]|uniref:Restriction endonuclease n=1 Tax=Leptospira selangorensis TaxID=2484982 RepID=A0ABY2MXM8_9LEPT|nr:hypothetical protein [Leptospira selangorensis]TGM11083.1 hypothetical protein EHQ82_21320 [Leptospira selangorensis]
MTNQDLLIEAIDKTLKSLVEKGEKASNCDIYSSWNSSYKYGGINIFETTFVDLLVQNLSKKVENIGWEVNYPSDENGEPWYRRKLDLGLGMIDRKAEPNSSSLQVLFETPIEVKKLPILEIENFFSVESELYIWQDIFKLFGYRWIDPNDKSNLIESVGKNKIMLTFSVVKSSRIEDFKNAMNSRFKNLSTLLNMEEIFKSNWFTKKESDFLRNENITSFDLRFILQKVLGWNDPESKYLIDFSGQRFTDKSLVRHIKFCCYEDKNNNYLVTSLLLL